MSRRSFVRLVAEWCIAISVSVGIGGLIGGSLGGVATAIVFVPWGERLLRRAPRHPAPDGVLAGFENTTQERHDLATAA